MTPRERLLHAALVELKKAIEEYQSRHESGAWISERVRAQRRLTEAKGAASAAIKTAETLETLESTYPDDPRVLAYWADWLKVRDSVVATGWTFAGYIAARVAQETPPMVTATDTTGPRVYHRCPFCKYLSLSDDDLSEHVRAVHL